MIPEKDEPLEPWARIPPWIVPTLVLIAILAVGLGAWALTISSW